MEEDGALMLSSVVEACVECATLCTGLGPLTLLWTGDLGADGAAGFSTGAGLGAVTAARTGCAGVTAGEEAALDLTLACSATTCANAGLAVTAVGAGVLTGGGGKGAIPIPAASFAAAAAAAEAYFSVSPGGFVGGGAGFIAGAGIVVDTGGAVCIVAKFGNGDLS